MDYGYFNQYIGREVAEPFWGTRTQHIVGVAAALAVTDHMSQAAFSRYLGRPLCFAKSPAAFVAHTFGFIFTGVALYCAGDAAWNPAYEGSRMETLKGGVYSSYIGANTAWFEPYVPLALARVAGPAIAGTWVGSSLLPATLAVSIDVGRTFPPPSNRCLTNLKILFCLLYSILQSRVLDGMTGETVV